MNGKTRSESDRTRKRIDPGLLRRIAKATDKPEKYVREQISKRARRSNVTSEVAQVVWASELGLGTASAFRRLQPHMQSQVRQLRPIEAQHEQPVDPKAARRIVVPVRRQPRRKSNTVMVVHGRNEADRDAMFEFLRTIGLQPIEWSQAVEATKKGAPSVGEIVAEAFRQAAAVVVILSPDDEARLRKKYLRASDPEYERRLTGQPRPNVLFEAGRAFGSHPDSTILTQVGFVRPFSDTAGLHVVHMNTGPECRRDLANRLEAAGCAVDLRGTDWLTAGSFPDSPSNAGGVAQRPGRKLGGPTRRKKEELPPPVLGTSNSGSASAREMPRMDQAEFDRRLLLSKVKEFEERGARLALQLHQEMESSGSQIRPHLQGLLNQWANDGHGLFEQVDSVESAMFLTDRPPKDDRYDGRLWEGYLNRRLGHVRRIKDVVKSGEM